MLPPIISSELFSIRHRVNDIAMEYIVDEFWKYRLRVTKIDDCDVFVYIDFVGTDIEGELKIDRFQKHFEIVARNKNSMILPAIGDWNIVLKYLTTLITQS